MDARSLTLDAGSRDGTLLEELGWLRDLACRLVADKNDADDLVQEAWLKARSTPAARFASRSRLRAWLAAVTRRMARDTQRARRRRALREERAARTEILGSAADVVERSALLEALLHAVRALDEPYRSTVLLRYMDAYSTAEVAVAMSVSEELVRKRLSRALARLRAVLAGEWGGALPACYEESLGTAQRGAPPHLLALGTHAGLLLSILALVCAGIFPPRATREPRTAPEASPVAFDVPSSFPGSGAVPSTPEEPALETLVSSADTPVESPLDPPVAPSVEAVLEPAAVAPLVEEAIVEASAPVPDAIRVENALERPAFVEPALTAPASTTREN